MDVGDHLLDDHGDQRFVFAFAVTILQNTLALLIAVLLNQRLRGRNFARISGPGRCRALAGLAEDVHRARSCGHRTIHCMETELPYAWLHPRGRRLSEAMAGEAWDRAA